MGPRYDFVRTALVRGNGPCDLNDKREDISKGLVLMITNYHAKLFAHELRKRHSAADSEKLASALLDAQVDLNPHQVEAALFAFKSPQGSLLHC
jgi:hypothetical protein